MTNPLTTFLDEPAEWHALSHGVYVGFTSHPLQTPPTPKREDVRRESHYYRGGYVVGSLLQVAILAAVAYNLLPPL